MAEDIVEFGAPTAPKPKRASSGRRPEWLNNRVLPVAAVGALCGLGSLMLPWQKLTLRPQQNTGAIIQQADQEIVEATLISLGAFGTAYLLTLIATVTAVAMMLFGHHLVPVATRVLGVSLSGANLFVLVATGIAFNRGTIILNVGFVTFGPEDWERTSISLEWGYLTALAAVALLGFAALRAQPVRWESGREETAPADESGSRGDEDGEPDDGVIDLSVSVHPVGKQVAAG